VIQKNNSESGGRIKRKEADAHRLSFAAEAHPAGRLLPIGHWFAWISASATENLELNGEVSATLTMKGAGSVLSLSHSELAESLAILFEISGSVDVDFVLFQKGVQLAFTFRSQAADEAAPR
jgi:hypothetical protein